MKQKKVKSAQDSREGEAGIPTRGRDSLQWKVPVAGLKNESGPGRKGDSRWGGGQSLRDVRDLKITRPQRCEGKDRRVQGAGGRPVREDSRALLCRPPPATMLWRK